MITAKLRNHKACRGISLIDALIGVAIISIGLLAVFRMHGEITAATGESKARAEAIQLADSTVERVRNSLSGAEILEVMSDHPRTGVEGVNATFDVDLNVEEDAENERQLNVDVSIAWQDVRGDLQELNIATHVLSETAINAVNLARGRLPSPNPIPKSSGMARTPGFGETPMASPESVEGFPDGTQVLREGDRTEVVGPDGGLLLIMEMPENPGFSTISGVVLQSGASEDLREYFIGPGEGASCVTTNIFEEEDTVWSQAGPNEQVDAIFYRCFVGVGWYGNIELRPRAGGVLDDLSVCVGDPDETDIESWDSREPFLSAVRRYRGFDSGSEKAIGIGRHPERGVERVDFGRPIEEMDLTDLGFGEDFSSDDDLGHDFLITDSDDCGDALTSASDEVFGNPDIFFMNSGFNYCIPGGNCDSL
ncbi:hypothetical protein M0534_12325 [Methylonatrum kenyense]|uniref:type IV pilus modification PilV family protein n=1 Tax=Methylonatrum kenyense TaxID=455253 RepID=UPI0020C01C78|nr:hypothetical protein [Methylonatrum kenyense]MCK8517107.1 hypothetical protein [Methylonatrum kenyense]